MLSQQVYQKDNKIKLETYVVALCHEMQPVGRVDWLRNRINEPQV